MPVQFFNQNIRFSIREKNRIRKNILAVIRNEKEQAGKINFIFCDDKFLLSLNKKFLRHNTYTDIITFQYPGKKLSAEIFISFSRVKENAKQFHLPFEAELHRVMIHGALHLCGYKDKTAAQKKEMREKENFYLNLYFN
ncbi:MAG TPA: rRNA maturation RNase YbeY [Bacteroidia bacterium]